MTISISILSAILEVFLCAFVTDISSNSAIERVSSLYPYIFYGELVYLWIKVNISGLLLEGLVTEANFN